MWKQRLLSLSIVLVGVSAYSTSFRGVFVLDDTSAIAWNRSIRALWPPTVPLSPPAGSTVSGRPVANLSLAINYALAPPDARDVFAPDPRLGESDERFLRNLWGYHVLNLAIHLAAGLALFGVVRRTLLSPRLRERFERHALPLAAMVAAIWVVHPLTTESVTYVIQRVESLMALFYLLTLYCAIRAISHPKFLTLSILFCALGMATKETMVTAPIIVWLWMRTFNKRDTARLPSASLFVGLCSTWIILVLLQLSHPRGATVGFSQGWTMWTSVMTQAQVVTHYLRLAIVPSPLVFSYAWPMATKLSAVVAPLALIAVLVVATVVGIVRRQPTAFLGAWFFGILAPTSSVIPVVTEIAAEQRMYLPVAAVISLAVVGSYLFIRRIAQAHVRVGLMAGSIAAMLVIVVFAVKTHARNRDYWSDERLWFDTVQKQPLNARAHAAYGADLFTARRVSEAERELTRAVELDPSNAFAQNALGAVLLARNRLDEAEGHFNRALEIWPFYVDALRNLGNVYERRHDDRRALAAYSKALDVTTDDPRLLIASARVLATSDDESVRDGARAVTLAEKAVRLTGGQEFSPLEILAASYAEANRFDDAVTAIRVAMSRTTPEIAASLQQQLRRYQAHQKPGKQ